MVPTSKYQERSPRGQGRQRFHSAGGEQRGKKIERFDHGRPPTPPPTHPVQRGNASTRDMTLKVIPIGGVEGIGRNCTIYEFGEDIIVIDLGIQFPEEDMHGIDFIIPNINYLRGKEKRIRGIFITHGHMDHIGAIPYLAPKLGNPPIYAAPLTAGLIQKRQEEFPRSPKLRIVRISNTAKIPVGKHFTIEPFHVTHNISDAFGLAIHTPVGTIIHTGDFKFDYTPVDDIPSDMGRLASFGAKGVLALLSDSTNAGSPGYQISEMQVGESLEQIIKGAKGRLIVGMFSSLITRLQQMMDIAAKEGRRVLLVGRSLQQNVEIAHQLGYLKFKKGVLMEEEDFRRTPDEKILVICTGAQGQKNAALMRIARGEDRLIDLKQGDTIVFSSSVIPGNERSIERLQDSLARRGAKVINYAMMDVHAGGHAKQEDLKLMIRLMQPKYFIPIHGTRFSLVTHGELAEECGVDPKNVFITDNGQIIEFTKHGGRLTNKKVPSDHVMVDGLGVGDVSHVVLRERQTMAEEGMIVVIVTIDEKRGEIVGSPDIISRGFIFMKDNQELIAKVRAKV